MRSRDRQRTLYRIAAIALFALGAARPGVAAELDANAAVARMGVIVPEAAARHGIGFRPFAPARRIVAVALLPPFRGADVKRNRGIAYEYLDDAGRRYALAQWPSNGGSVDAFPALADGDARCPGAHQFIRGTGPSGIVWTTPRGLVMTLQADGKNDARTLQTEWSKLIRRGACR